MSIFRGALSREATVAQDAARAAGAYLIQRLGVAHGQKSKAAHDTQLDVDLGAEQLVLKALREAFPDDAILSEEADLPPATASRSWIIDPLDGSFNFQHAYPMFGIAIALQLDGSTALGVLYLPIGDEMYVAVKGHGAYCNGAPIHTSATARLGDAIIHVSDFAFTGRPSDNLQRLQVMSAIASTVGRVRMVGTAVADFAWLARGCVDGVIMYSTHPWDVEGGGLLVAEAGGIVTRVRMSNGESAYVGGNASLHQRLAELVTAASSDIPARTSGHQ